VDLVVKSKIGTHAPAQFEPGVVCKFSGVHPETNTKILKVLILCSNLKLT
jgi:hypothetical protein